MNYKEIYLNNNYQIENKLIFSLKEIEEYKNNNIFKRKFAIITAYNPLNEKKDIFENQENNLLLEEDLEAYEYLNALGYLDKHFEDGFLVFDIDFEEAIKLANKYKQYAIFYNDMKKLGYYKCENNEVIVEKMVNQ